MALLSNKYNGEDLGALLNELHDRFNDVSFIEDDPISIPHRYAERLDREIAGFMSATIAWGNRKAIVKSAHRMMEYMDDSPAEFVLNASDVELQRLESYVHRTFNGFDFKDFVVALRTICQRYGGIGELFEKRFAESGSMADVFAFFRREFFSAEHAPRCEKHLSSIEKGAACKRLCMYSRWMVRSDKSGVDFGIWKGIPSSALYMPLDVHSGNVARELGILERKQSDWKAVVELTERLKEFDANDPVKYDFALFGAGIGRVFK
ncbi:MAG: TIGR02757 family protein [Rikenellaceae bacterium]